ncbi:VanZ family protein [Kitasatospora sp. NPDC096147]|uniref:VanZ family protein n=1 Tax=Kitasatospora sp. NPDC096147 TaxID=3364093 RepID=UPI0037F9DDF0
MTEQVGSSQRAWGGLRRSRPGTGAGKQPTAPARVAPDLAPPTAEPTPIMPPTAPLDGPPGPADPAGHRRSWTAVAARWLVLTAAFLASVAFAAALARVTLVPVPGAVGQVHSNLRPGDSLHHYLTRATTLDAARQVGGNVLLGVPFGLLLPVLWPKARGAFRVLVRTAAVMLLVELVQGALITGRAFDVDDVLLNTTGALLGYLLLGRRLTRVVRSGRRPRRLPGRPGSRPGPAETGDAPA